MKRVLVVDDKPDLRTIIGQVLREAGHDVVARLVDQAADQPRAPEVAA